MGDVLELRLERGQVSAVGLVDTSTGEVPRQETRAELVWDGEFLHVRFECTDDYVWGNYTERDEPIYEEEVVEMFLAPGTDDPKCYFEFEVSPEAVLWDGWIELPNLTREGMVGHPEWDCEGIQWGASQHPGREVWEGWFSLPLRELWEEGKRLFPGGAGEEFPAVWRGNLYRIDRPAEGAAETTAWCPTLNSPADFHAPRRFGRLVLGD